MSKKVPPKKHNTRLASTAIKPAFPDLREKYGTVEKLEKHLTTLDKTALQALILNGAFPEEKSNLRHCVYCHKTFNTEDNDGQKCKVEHFMDQAPLGRHEDGSFLCCGKLMDWTDWDEGHERPEDLEPYCYEGVHWEREITTDDEEEFGEEELGMLSEWGEKLRRVWWREWREDGRSCKKEGCRGLGTKVKGRR